MMAAEEYSQDLDKAAVSSGRGRPLDTWAGRVTKSVAMELRYWREAQGLTAQELSDMTEKLGSRVKKSVIVNLENNRRDSIDLAELLVLAAALNVPPVILIAPVGREESVEVLPDRWVSPWEARGWIHGVVPQRHPLFSLEDWNRAKLAFTLYDIHRILMRRYERVLRDIESLSKVDEMRELGDDGSEPGSDINRLIHANDADRQQLQRAADRLRDSLVSHRELVESLGFKVPDVTPAVSAELAGSGIPPERL